MDQDTLTLLCTVATATPCPTPSASTAGSVGLDGGSVASLLLAPAIIAAVISGLVTFLGLWPASKLRRREAAEASQVAFNDRALNEFYAPIRELLSEVRILRDEIKTRVNKTGDPGWHTLDHVEDIRKDPVALALFEAIVKVNTRIKEILDTKSGLALDEVSKSGRWRVHHSLLEHTLKTPGYEAGTTLSYFPTEFEDQINAGFTKAVAEREAHRESASKKKGWW